MDRQQRERCVVNASVALKWHLPQEPFAQQTIDLLNDWRKGALDLFVRFIGDYVPKNDGEVAKPT